MLCRSPRRKKKSFSSPCRSPSLDCRNSLATALRPLSWTQTIIGIKWSIVTIAGGVEPAESSTIAGSAKGYSTRGSCEDTGPLWHRHVFQSSFGSLAGRKKDEANVPVSTCSMPASSSSTRRPRGPGARMDQNVYVSMTTRRVRSTRRKKPSFARSAPLWAWQQTKIALG